MFKHKNALAVTSEGCFLCCAVFLGSSGLDVQNLLWMGRRRACLVLSTHFQQLVYFIFLCQSYCRLFSVDSCTAVWTTIGNVVAAVGKLLTFEAVMAGIAVVKFQFIITSVLLRACNVCGYRHSGMSVCQLSILSIFLSYFLFLPINFFKHLHFFDDIFIFLIN